MLILYTNQKSPRTRKQRDQEKKIRTSQYVPKSKFKIMTRTKPDTFIRPGAEDFKKIRSIESNDHVAPKTPIPVYTGTAIIGIAVMHKSNAVPVFSKQQAEDISKMRR